MDTPTQEVPPPTANKIYLAARYSRYPEMQGYAEQLRRSGYTVTARWILGDHELRSEGQSEADAWAIRWAQEDWDDLMSADIVISFTEGPGNIAGRARGGRHVEFGAAMAAGKKLIVVGFRENVFHHLPGVTFMTDWDSALMGLMVPAAIAAALNEVPS